ncbi:hypothetical protein ACF1BN_13490 [Streptomyces sp. NPDC014861]|uniref:hypothetical protein n=1 Tax=Streptomyces sp. NPDC014861 TaxID=3364923 RepID=UPI0036FB2D5E
MRSTGSRATPAAARTELVPITPAPDASLDAPPASIALTFSDAMTGDDQGPLAASHAPNASKAYLAALRARDRLRPRSRS